ncbi:MAG TPA: hypothetical protein VMT00_16690 [Thermoanaerobaculia bacterium]|nr:hypothetical protein [Thermoanaerobaculia bacterium]
MSAGRDETSAGELDSRDRDHRALMRRVRGFAALGWVVFAAYCLISRGLWAFLGLTCSALVAMINFLWLEDLIEKVLQPAPRVSAWKLGSWSVARFALFGVALAVAIFVIRFDALSVLLGFSIIVVGIMAEAVYSTWKSFVSNG